MTFDVEINGRVRTVSVERAAQGGYRVTIDGRPHAVDAARVGTLGLSLLLDRGGVSRDVQIAPAGRNGELLIRIDGRTIAATLNGNRSGRGAADAAGHAHGEQSVVAPMPGRVVRVLVERGETVAARQGIVVVEAMKMENELRAPKAGRVKDVVVGAGDPVEAGRVLVVIE
jgi:biotin carboxyl carrier protein